MRGRLLLLLLLSGCAHSSRIKTVEAEGWASLSGGDRREAKERALADALKKAVELVAGVSVASDTRVEDAVSVKQRIQASSDGVVRRYRVLSEREEDGFLKTRVRASVAFEKPEEARGRTIAILIEDPQLAQAVRVALSGKRFRLVEEGQPADVTIKGRVEARAITSPMLGRMSSYRARASLDAVSAKAGTSLREAREASALDADGILARDQAVDEASRLAAESLAAQLR